MNLIRSKSPTIAAAVAAMVSTKYRFFHDPPPRRWTINAAVIRKFRDCVKKTGKSTELLSSEEFLRCGALAVSPRTAPRPLGALHRCVFMPIEDSPCVTLLDPDRAPAWRGTGNGHRQ